MSVHPVVDVVVPTVSRPTLTTLLGGLSSGHPLLGSVIVVDDRRDRSTALRVPVLEGDPPIVIVAGDARGPAAARNVGWRRATASWVAFLDDDVELPPGWLDALVADLVGADPDVAAIQGRIEVPLPRFRRPTDWERNVAGLETARWVTADMAIRREALLLTGGFDERFTRAYREDVDLALRLDDGGWRVELGRRSVRHPVRPAGRWVSVALQANNAADPLMTVAHGRRWRRRLGIAAGRRTRHLVTTSLAIVALTALAARRRRTALLAGLGWSACFAELAWARIAPGPRTPDEIATMLATSVAIPPMAVGHWAAGWLRLPGQLRRDPHGAVPGYPAAVFFDRDGTLVKDVPYNGDPDLVELEPHVPIALARLRAHGVPIGVLTNQSGVARGVLSISQVDDVNRRLDELAGPFDVVRVCPHDAEGSCGCRKPAPGMVQEAARILNVDPSRCAVVGDIASDIDAAEAAGARGILVPNDATRVSEVASAREVVNSVSEAVDLLLGGGR